MDRISPIVTAAMKAEESAASILAEGAILGVTAIALYGAGKISDAHHRNKLAKKQAEIAKAETANKQSVQQHLDAFQKHYKISVAPIPDGSFKSERDVYNAMLSDVKKWVSQITSSQAYTQAMQKVCDAHNSGSAGDNDPLWFYEEEKVTVKTITSWFKIGEGVNGWQESIEISDGDQEERSFLEPIISDIVLLLKTKYENYLSSVSNGDGDEGTIYYHIKMR